MKGLQAYIRKHGQHFTPELAYDVMGRRWTFQEIDKALCKEVYYNVSGCTPGDIIYYCNSIKPSNKKEFVSWMKAGLQNIVTSSLLFPVWLSLVKSYKPDFDFTPYV